MVERMHRTLKVSMRCTLFAAFKSVPEVPWPKVLPAVLLGLRTTFKEDLQAEIVFGTSLRILGTFINPKPLPSVASQDFFGELWCLFNAIRPVPESGHSDYHPFVLKDLATTEYVFRRIDSVKKPLEQPYSGLHRVAERINDLDYVVDVNLAHLAATSSQVSQATQPSLTIVKHSPTSRASTPE